MAKTVDKLSIGLSIPPGSKEADLYNLGQGYVGVSIDQNGEVIDGKNKSIGIGLYQSLQSQGEGEALTQPSKDGFGVKDILEEDQSVKKS